MSSFLRTVRGPSSHSKILQHMSSASSRPAQAQAAPALNNHISADVKHIHNPKSQHCEAFLKGKGKHAAHPPSNHFRPGADLGSISTDTIGPLSEWSARGGPLSYYLMRTKAQAPDLVKPYTADMEESTYNVCNRLPHSSLPNNTTPYQKLTGHKNTHQQLQPINCRVFALKRDAERLGPAAKVLERADAGIHLGCARYCPGYYVQLYSDSRVIETSDPQPPSGPQEPEDTCDPEATTPGPALLVQNNNRREAEATHHHTLDTSRDQQRPRRRTNNPSAADRADKPHGPPVFGLLSALFGNARQPSNAATFCPDVLDADSGLLQAMTPSSPSVNA
eukprot:4427791-Pleurochrysis_carterae.AAC.1